MILCDAGPLICLVDSTQPGHGEYTRAIKQVRKPLITTWVCIAEAMHFALNKGRWPMQRQLLQPLKIGWLIVSDIQVSDYSRLAELMEKYQDRPMDLADATLVVTAEKLNTTQILTLDSDFWIYRIYDRVAFDVIQVGR